VHAFVELHIEQSAVLECMAATIGVVSSIVGVARFMAVFAGRRDHAGTMSMHDRRDAGAAAAQAMVAWEALARADGVSVITTGSVDLEPGAVNIVPERASVVAEVRSPTTARRVELQHALAGAARQAANERGVRVELRWLSEEPAVPADDRVRAVIEGAARALGHEPVTVVSGAEHDAAHLAALGPMGMIFVPSRDGRSHCPEEWTDIEAIGAGVDALARTLVELDGVRWQ
jgi:N-carbamoyl-L-amino-acid hydrolase